MVKLEPQIMKSMQLIARQYPEFVEFLEHWKHSELEQLPDVAVNTGVAQGRCKVLKELTSKFAEAPGWTV